MSNKYEVTFTVETPIDAPIEDVEAFIEFELGAVSSLRGDNAFSSIDLRSCKVYRVDVRE